MAPALAVDDAAALRRLERAENFPVALRVLPAARRRDLRAAYATARLIDDVGDDPARSPAQRLELLDALEAQLRTAFEPAPVEAAAPAVLATLAPGIAAGTLRLDPFLALVEANRLDQRVTRYPTYDDLRHYCSLSANPVGRIVLDIFGLSDPELGELSDDVCTALQILEHCQDVVEDKATRDRVYLPLEDLERFGVELDELDAAWPSLQLRRLVGFEVDRAAALLDRGAPLVRRLHGWARVSVAGYVAGGRATVDALRRCDHDVVRSRPRPRRRDVLRHAVLGVGGGG